MSWDRIFPLSFHLLHHAQGLRFAGHEKTVGKNRGETLETMKKEMGIFYWQTMVGMVHFFFGIASGWVFEKMRHWVSDPI